MTTEISLVGIHSTPKLEEEFCLLCALFSQIYQEWVGIQIENRQALSDIRRRPRHHGVPFEICCCYGQHTHVPLKKNARTCLLDGRTIYSTILANSRYSTVDPLYCRNYGKLIIFQC